MLFCCLWRNVETSCYKHFVDVSREQQTTPLTTSGSVTTCHGSAAACWQHLAASQRWQLAAKPYIGSESHRDFCLPHLHSTPPLWGPLPNTAMPFGTEKLEWFGYPMVKNVWRYVYSFWHNSRTWQTDTQTHTHRERERDRHRMTA